MAESNRGRRLRIAIAGGGLAGGILMNVLVRHPHLDIHIYESAPEFSERGASLGISGISQKALAEMSPDLIDVLHDAGAVPQNSNRFVVVSGGLYCKLEADFCF
jgi:salicylate hydroxylase